MISFSLWVGYMDYIVPWRVIESQQKISQKMQETNGEALLYFCQQATFGVVGVRGAPGVTPEIEWSRKAEIAIYSTGDWPESHVLIHVKFLGSFSVGSMTWSDFSFKASSSYSFTSSLSFTLLQFPSIHDSRQSVHTSRKASNIYIYICILCPWTWMSQKYVSKTAWLACSPPCHQKKKLAGKLRQASFFHTRWARFTSYK